MNKSLVIIAAAAAMVGCANTGPAQYSDFNDLNNMRLDCANRDARIRYFESQLSTANTRIYSNLSFDPQRGTINDRSRDAVLRELLAQHRQYCPDTSRKAR